VLKYGILIKRKGRYRIKRLLAVLWDAEDYVRTFAKEQGRVPTNEEYRAYLLSHPEFSK
jgi:hypothetical protein